MIQNFISPCRRVILVGILLAMFSAQAARGQDEWSLSQRLDDLVAALDTGSAGRTAVLDTIYSELRGPNGREMHEILLEALSRGNSLIVQGAIQALAMLGDTDDIANIEALLATSDKIEVKLQIVRLLPAYCLGVERARLNYIRYAVGYDRIARPEILEPLRRPPLTRRGRLDSELERMQGRVIRSIASQFDPVGAALAYVDDILYGRAARSAIVHLVGNALGNDPGQWARIWAAQGAAFRVPDEVEELRLAALNSLADMGAEGLPEVIAAFRMLENVGGEVLPQAAFETMREMCRIAFDQYPGMVDGRYGVDDQPEAQTWAARRFLSSRNLALYTARSAGSILSEALDPAVFHAAALAMGAALSFPPGFPDPGSALAAEKAMGLGRLERLLLMPDISRERRSSVVLALGEVATLRAVAAIAGIIDSPYCSSRFGEDGTRLAESAIDALRNAAVGQHEGRANARILLLGLLGDRRVFPALRAGAPPVGLAHMVLWRFQRLAGTSDIILDPEVWRERLGW